MTKKQERESQVTKYAADYYAEKGEKVISSKITNSHVRIDKDGYYRYNLYVYTNLGYNVLDYYAKFDDENKLIL